MPPEASTNLPRWRSVAPVKAPFSWPNRIDSTRLSGIAPQLTATNGLVLRSPLPWMARANNSLPTPDSPSISTGMVEAAAFCAVRSTPAMVSLRVTTSANVRRPSLAVADALQFALQRAGVERIAQADLQPLDADRLDHEILGAGAHRRHHIVDAAMGGLHDDGDVEAGFADFGQHAHAVEAGHDEIEHHGVDGLRVRRGQRGDRGIAAIDNHGLIAAFLHHVFDQATRYRIVIGNQNGRSHGIPRTLQLSVSNRGTLADAD